MPSNDFRSRFREAIRIHWDDFQWPALGLLWAAALVCGYLGFARNQAARGQSTAFLDLAYLTLQLISLESGDVQPPVGWMLNVARYLVPVLTAATALKALATVFQEQVLLARLPFRRGHVLICGLSRKGYLLATGFRQRGETVVVIEKDEDNDLLPACRAQGITTLTGDAAKADLLLRAGADRAQTLIAVCDDDATNAKIASRAREVAYRRSDPLTCIIHVVDPQLCELLKEREMILEAGGQFRLELFNIFDRGARELLAAHPPLPIDPSDPHPSPRILIAGLGRLGWSLVIHLARDWREAHPSGPPLRLVLIDRDIRWKVDVLAVRYPHLPHACTLEALHMDLRSPEFEQAAFLWDGTGACDVHAIYICLENDTLGLRAGLSLHRRLNAPGRPCPRPVPIVIRTAEDTGLAALLKDAPGAGAFDQLSAFPLLSHTCTPGLLLGGTHEILARAVYAESAAGQAPVPWEALPEAARQPFRRRIDRLGRQLQQAGCSLAPLTDWEAGAFQLAPAEIEAIARQEYELERFAPGGPRVPPGVPWADLPPDQAAARLAAAAGLPRFLARAGFQINRAPVTPTR